MLFRFTWLQLGCNLASREEFAIAIPDNLHSLSSYLVLIAGWQVSECSFDQTLTRLKYILPKIHFPHKNTSKKEKNYYKQIWHGIKPKKKKKGLNKIQQHI